LLIPAFLSVVYPGQKVEFTIHLAQTKSTMEEAVSGLDDTSGETLTGALSSSQVEDDGAQQVAVHLRSSSTGRSVALTASSCSSLSHCLHQPSQITGPNCAPDIHHVHVLRAHPAAHACPSCDGNIECYARHTGHTLSLAG
jgi:hypothetical protein